MNYLTAPTTGLAILFTSGALWLPVLILYVQHAERKWADRLVFCLAAIFAVGMLQFGFSVAWFVYSEGI